MSQTRDRPATGRDYAAKFETRMEENGQLIVDASFARFDDRYEFGEWGFETIDPHAFDNTLNRDVVCLWNHDTGCPLGRVSNETLSLRVTDIGLNGTVILNPNDSMARDAYERIRRGDVKQCSFGFDILREEMIKHDDGKIEWRIQEVLLYEVSPVTFPAYESTTISARERQLKQREERELAARKAEMKERVDQIAQKLGNQEKA